MRFRWSLTCFLLLGLLSGFCSHAHAASRLFIIACGVSDYAVATRVPPLQYAAGDARAMARALTAGGQSLLGTSGVTTLLLVGERGKAAGSQTELPATKNALREAFAATARQMKPEDRLVVFLAGHGLPIGEDYAYLTQDAAVTDLKNSPFQSEWTVSSGELKSWLAAMPSRQRLLILDTCAAGAFAGQEAPPAGTEGGPQTGRWTGGQEILLMGSAADAVAHEAPRFGHGLLTFALLEGLRGPALEQGTLKVGPWVAYAQRRVGELARSVMGAQVPIVATPPQSQNFDVGSFTPGTLAKVPPVKVLPLLLAPRLSTRDDPGNPFDRSLEKALAIQLKAAQSEGKLQLVEAGGDLGGMPPDVWRCSGLMTRQDGLLQVDMVLRQSNTMQKIAWQGQDADVQIAATGLARMLLDRLAKTEGTQSASPR